MVFSLRRRASSARSALSCLLLLCSPFSVCLLLESNIFTLSEEAVLREVYEECRVSAEFSGVIGFRQQHRNPNSFDRSDLLIICRLRLPPGTTGLPEIRPCQKVSLIVTLTLIFNFPFCLMPVLLLIPSDIPCSVFGWLVCIAPESLPVVGMCCCILAGSCHNETLSPKLKE